MNWWNIHVKVGLVVIIGFILLGILLVKAANSPWSTGGDLVRANFDFVNDLRVGAAVQLAGVQIGKVTKVELSEDGTHVEVQMRVEDAFKRLHRGTVVEIGIIGFVGEAYIKLTNGPVANPLLQPTDMPLTGRNPIGVSDLLERAEKAVTQATQLAESANQLIASGQTNVNDGLAEVRALIEQTSHVVEEIGNSTQETMTALNRIAQNNDFRFEQTLRRFNRLIDQLENDSILISSQASDITRTVLDFVNQNSAPVEGIIDDLQVSSTNFRQTSEQLDQNLTELKTELSGLINQSRNAIETETPRVDGLLENLTRATDNLDELRDSLAELLDKIQHGEGFVSQLLNEPSPLEETHEALKTAQATMRSIQDLSEALNRKSARLNLPGFAWDYELRYLSLEESLHNELAFLILPSPRQRYRFGLGVRREDVKFEFQYSYDFTDYLRGRMGFMRSKAGLGFDVWLLSRKLGLTIEGTRLTSKDPELNAEATWRLLPFGHIIVGAENLTDDISYTAGFRLSSRNW